MISDPRVRTTMQNLERGVSKVWTCSGRESCSSGSYCSGLRRRGNLVGLASRVGFVLLELATGVSGFNKGWSSPNVHWGPACVSNSTETKQGPEDTCTRTGQSQQGPGKGIYNCHQGTDTICNALFLRSKGGSVPRGGPRPEKRRYVTYGWCTMARAVA